MWQCWSSLRAIGLQAPHGQSKTADAAADADGEPKPAKRARLSDKAQQNGTANAAVKAAHSTADAQQPDYLASVSAFVRAAEKAGAPLTAGDGVEDEATASARKALKEAEDSVNALLAGEASTSVSCDCNH